MSVLEKAQELQQMMKEGKSMEAFEKFYHEDVVVIEMPTGERREGKAAQREAILHWFGMVKEVIKEGVISICSDETNEITTTESWMDVVFHDGSAMNMSEVAVQQWKDGQIIEEKFYYNMPGE